MRLLYRVDVEHLKFILSTVCPPITQGAQKYYLKHVGPYLKLSYVMNCSSFSIHVALFLNNNDLITENKDIFLSKVLIIYPISTNILILHMIFGWTESSSYLPSSSISGKHHCVKFPIWMLNSCLEGEVFAKWVSILTLKFFMTYFQ